MKTIVRQVLLILSAVQQLSAQTPGASLLVQSPDGKKVMLLWSVKTWGPGITGFDIKRKEGLQDWVKLNSEPILPGISMRKKLSVVDGDKNEVSKLEARLYKMLATYKIKETETAAFIQKLMAGDTSLQRLSERISTDYELALMSGFAFIDRSVTKKATYEYGLFVQGTDKLLARASWNYGEIPDLNTVKEIQSNAVTSVKGVQVKWSTDQQKMKQALVMGYNIYREGIRLNAAPITAPDGNAPAGFTWSDKSANSALPIQYSISAVSVFGIEGIIKSYNYDPAEHPGEYKLAKVSEIASSGYYLKEGINVKWQFPKEDERFLRGFYIEKDNMPVGYTRVSPLLEPGTRSFLDKTASPVNSYIRFRLISVYNDGANVAGKDRLYSYFPVNEPPAPQNVKAKLDIAGSPNGQAGKKYSVHLSWDPPMAGDDMTDYYKIYAWEPQNNRFFFANEGHPVKTGSYSYTIQDAIPGQYRFYVSAMGKSTSESVPGDTVSVVIPLPAPALTKVSQDSAVVTVQWDYPPVPGLRGFRLFQNNELIAEETDLRQNIRSFTTPKMAQGTNCQFYLQAVSETGVISERSRTLSISLPGGGR